MKKSIRPTTTTIVLLLLSLLCCLIIVTRGDENNHYYQYGEEVTLWYNSIGPFRNPLKSWSFDHFQSWCLTADSDYNSNQFRKGLFFDSLAHTPLVSSNLPILFGVSMESPQFICNTTINSKNKNELIDAIDNEYMYHMYLDSLSMIGRLGGKDKDKDKQDGYYLFSNRKLLILHNDHQIVGITLVGTKPIYLKEKLNITFSYSVEWYESFSNFNDRLGSFTLDTDNIMQLVSAINNIILIIVLFIPIGIIYYSNRKKPQIVNNDEEMGINNGNGNNTTTTFLLNIKDLILFSSFLGIGFQFTIIFMVFVFTCLIGLQFQDSHVMNVIVFTFPLASIGGGIMAGGYLVRSNPNIDQKTPSIIYSLSLPTILIGLLTGSRIFFPPINTTSLLLDSIQSLLGSLSILSIFCIPFSNLGYYLSTKRNIRFNFKLFNHHNNNNSHTTTTTNRSTSLIILLAGILPFLSLHMYAQLTLSYLFAYKSFHIALIHSFELIAFIIIVIQTNIIISYFLLQQSNNNNILFQF
ncbi:hypothetical protein DFA_07763 [Cavenderia fasciculata]|uniref:Transmembrane 9 superfamily member n=1 Tax=Cavenderia fasciculata TaxID=261658 RepID=F4Q363_CACFS|nr:uncharacterized protein DFA_07763 [Cavenderia fasciculata]EGG16785.1 hypothetical protein DFA_07763 [Cavenderia fasciculata]|eukprot:XP_004355259.1 hypothetical protein DFA_07763 [Cavenderia fasciculata]